METAMTEKLHQLKRCHVPEEEMMPLLCRAFYIKTTKDVVKKPRHVSDLTALRSKTKNLAQAYFTEMGPHGYAVLNVLTDYASRPVGMLSPETSTNGLQQRSGSWIDKFVSAIKSSDFSFDHYLADCRKNAQVIESL